MLPIQNHCVRIARRIRRELRALAEKLRNCLQPTYTTIVSTPHLVARGRFSFINPDYVSASATELPAFRDLVLEQATAVIAHSFDLLGSGPTVVAHGIQCRGVNGHIYPPCAALRPDEAGYWLYGRINSSNLRVSQRIWQLVTPDYVPIDWQLDFKSGYRWSESTWHRDIRFGHLPGVDVKVPWELGRLQHLPMLVLAGQFAKANVSGFQEPTLYEREFRNQVLDFIATNPPGFGVNWACAMDVGIRCANLLVAHDIAVASGAQLDEAFERIFAASILAHARHIVSNLEWSPVYRGNHYLANVVGLLFTAAGP